MQHRISRLGIFLGILWILSSFPVSAQNKKVNEVDRTKKAIDSGVEYLLQNLEKDPGEPAYRGDELVLYALIHATAEKSDKTDKELYPILKKPQVDKLLKTILSKPLEKSGGYPVYNVALRAMLLSKIDPSAYQQEIAQCAWWLVNAQTDNGQWDYYGPSTPMPEKFKTVVWRSKLLGPGEKLSEKQKPSGSSFYSAPDFKGPKVDRVEEWGSRPGASRQPGIYRNTSTAQYAILGLVAAHRAHVVLPHETFQRAFEAAVRTQTYDGGWGYLDPKDKDNGWKLDYAPMTSMTVSMIVVLAAIQDIMENPDPRVKTIVNRGFDFLSQRGVDSLLKKADYFGPGWTPESDPLALYKHLYFYYGLYSLERAGILWGKVKIGELDWYTIGANDLIATQAGDGSWGVQHGSADDRLVNTSFAILFLKRAVLWIRSGE